MINLKKTIKMNRKIFLVFCLSLLALLKVSGQGLLCEESEPFCTGSIYTFPAGTTGQAQPGAYYGCLSTQPAPAWYHMLIDNPGMIQIYMYSQPSVDIDFICWGPFADPYEPCVQGLTSGTVVDCSYSPNPTEYCDIPNGQTGQYYILLITNYSQQPCEITFSQTAGSGSTDCTILPPPVGNNGPLCVGDTLHLYAETVPNASYYWSGPAGFLSTQQNPVIPNVTTANAGNYQCVITVNGQSSDPAITSVIIYNLPTAGLLTADTTVCAGNVVYAIMQFTGWGPFKVTYNNGSNTFVATNLYAPQDTIFLYPSAPTTYTFTKVEDLHCSRNLLYNDLVVGTFPPATGTLSGSGTICAGEPANLTFDLTGTPPWSITYTINGGSPQIVAANVSPYVLPVYPTTTTTYAFTNLEDINCSGSASGQAVISVDPSPTSNAGNDQTIAYGTSTTLSGQVSGGSGNYSYAWQPANKLTNPNVQQPTTINLTETTLFTLTGTDNVGGCFDADEVLVTITGGPLGCFPAADPPVICFGETSQLQSLASGGSGSYSFLWSSNPPGFTSTISNPVVTPGQTTTYNVSVNDGYNVTLGNVTVTVHQLPLPLAGNDVTIPHGTKATLMGSASGGSGNYQYHWEPADKLNNPNIANPTTVNLYSTTQFNLTVTDVTTGCQSGSPDQVSVIISGAALAVNPSAVPDELCYGESTQLFALAGGGSGNYTSYSWICSNGFSSSLENPVTTPQTAGSFIYTCTVGDGFNFAQGSVAVNVRAVPFIELGFADTTICVYDTITLDAGNPGSTYVWSNGSSEKTVDVATTGIGFDMQTYSVTITNQSGCTATSSVNIVFDFSACSGIEGLDGGAGFRIYPNPGNGTVRLVMEPGIKEVLVSVTNIFGQNVMEPCLFSDLDGNGEVELFLGDQPEGIYFIHGSNKDYFLGTLKYILKK
jgi:hypothetical protein